MKQLTGELASATAKASPSVGVAVASLGGVPLQDWVYLATLVYTGLLIVQVLGNNWGKWRIFVSAIRKKIRR